MTVKLYRQNLMLANWEQKLKIIIKMILPSGCTCAMWRVQMQRVGLSEGSTGT